MEVENEVGHQQNQKWNGYVDWKGRPALRRRHGGFLAASFVLVVEVMENMGFLANASNLVLYVSKDMHFTPSKSSNTVTNFMGTAFLLALVGGFLSDALFTTYQVYLTSASIEFLGLVILTVQAYKPSLQPPQCNPMDPTAGGGCRGLNLPESAMLYIGLYLVAAGVGGIKGSLPTHGAEQFDESTPQGRINRSTFFNYFVFCLSAGGLIATTFVVWVEDNKGWKWGFFISTMTILLSIPVFLSGSSYYRNKIPSGSPLTTISKVLVAGIVNSCMSKNSSNAVANMVVSPPPIQPKKHEDEAAIKGQEMIEAESTTLTQSYKFLNNATINPNPISPTLECTIKEVEEVKIVLKMLPIFASTIILNCCLAQLSTFSVEQAASMDTKLGSLIIPPASLPVFPIVIIMVLAPVYDHLIIPFARNLTKRETGISHLQRIGTGLLLSIAAMAVAALVEVKRKGVAIQHNMVDSIGQPLPVTFFWIAIQYALLGSADLFCLAGMLEFFFTEAPSSMRSLATSLSWASLAIGYYLSSVIVSIVNAATTTRDHDHSKKAWLYGNNLNHYHLDRFYWLLCVLGALNFLNYLFWASKYKYTSTGSKK